MNENDIQDGIREEMKRLDWSGLDVQAMFPDLQGEELLDMLIGAEPRDDNEDAE